MKFSTAPTNGADTSAPVGLPKIGVRRIMVPREVSLSVGRLVAKLLVSANSYCSSDLFVLACRLISCLCCIVQPAIGLAEIFDQLDLNKLIQLNISSEFNHGSVCWGSPWSQHALLSLFMDVIENEKFVGMMPVTKKPFAIT